MLNVPNRKVLLYDEHNDPSVGDYVEFYLNYRGPLRATQRDPKEGSNIKAAHWQLKHAMRKGFHRQLKQQWSVTPFLQDSANTQKPYQVDLLAKEFQLPPWRFVPLVTGRLQLVTGIDILLQRLDNASSSVWSGDIDNRIKTIIDALEVPRSNDGYAELTPDSHEDPFFCLLENDRYLNHVAVETANLLDAPDGADMSYADVRIKVRIRPDNLIWDNIGF
ncbi:hypothetical protein ASD50_11270 [Mesorhizobium sp. Root552]|uniref:hypothetical protein n=1 Tax=Mesorhizobium sp. Root552 TaxID=1736555 RepID=UPI0006FFD374|nr:hypothetical protein [Mesorhizobium sp. Root552]KQZ16413.1 hypothetical protein ASD50_11270 [Mesorhizobium sp. Root552]